MTDILMAVYNGENYIKEQLNSIIRQTVKDWHLYICDDCSSDNTVDIVLDYVNKYPDKITLVQNSENMGHKAVFFKLLRMSKGDYVFTFDQDDVWKKDKIAVTLKGFQNEDTKTPVLVHTDLTIVNQKLEITSPSMIKSQHIDVRKNKPNDMLVQNIVTGCTMAMNRALVDILHEPKKVPVHDWWIATVASFMGKIKFVNKSTMYYRQHSENSVGAKIMSIDYIVERMRKGKYNKDMLSLGYNLASEILACYGTELKGEERQMLKAYSKMSEKNKIEKIKTVAKFKLWKSGIVRKIGQIIYM